MRCLELPEAVVTESVQFRNGLYRLEGEFLYPESAAPTGAVVIANPHPMLGGDMRNNVVRGIGDGLAEHGLAVLRFNYRGVGQSEGPKIDVASHLARFWETSHIPDELELHADLEAAIGFLRAAVSAELPIAAIGYSFGCALLPHVRSIGSLDALILVAPTIAKHDYVPYLSVNLPMLVIAPEDDFATNSATVRHWFSQISAPKQLVSTRRDNHFFRGHETWLVEIVHTFLSARWSQRRMPIADERLREVLALHVHPKHGSTYWLARQERLGFSVLDRIRAQEDLWLLGQSSLDDLRRFPIRAFIPQAFHDRLDRFIIGETAGTSGEPRATAYRADEFQAAFVDPFLEAAGATGFPKGLPWLWVGPSGPHIIGKAVRELARQTGSMDPFSVDFDPRWAKRLAEGSLALRRYLDHVTSQAIDVLEREAIGVLFTTPPALTALAGRMSDEQRESIRGVHYGGLSVTAAQLNQFREQFPNAVHLSGYGNSLFGVVMEVADRPRGSLNYFPRGERVCFEVVRLHGQNGEGAWPPRPCERGETGRVMFHRFDESCLLTGILERDEAERIAPSPEARALGWNADGLRDPRPPARAEGNLRIGLY